MCACAPTTNVVSLVLTLGFLALHPLVVSLVLAHGLPVRAAQLHPSDLPGGPPLPENCPIVAPLAKVLDNPAQLPQFLLASRPRDHSPWPRSSFPRSRCPVYAPHCAGHVLPQLSAITLRSSRNLSVAMHSCLLKLRTCIVCLLRVTSYCQTTSRSCHADMNARVSVRGRGSGNRRTQAKASQHLKT